MEQLTLKIGRRFSLKVSSPEEASKEFCRLRDESCEGSSLWPDGKLSNGMVISYNGRVWTGQYNTKPDLVCEAQYEGEPA